MIKGLYAAASSMLVNAARQEVLSHNISNLDTPGFKQILLAMEEFTTTQVNMPAGRLPNMGLVRSPGILGLGTEISEEKTDFTEGRIDVTGNEWDLAINGTGFFRVQTDEGERYSRDGRFLRDSEGFLVNSDGFYVLDTNGQKIELPEGMAIVSTDGTISINEEVIGQIGLANFENPVTELVRVGANTYQAQGEPSAEAGGVIRQYALESTNVDVAQISTQMIMVARSYEAAQQMVQTHDELLAKTINTLGSF
jgi:flagellar basal body rod protein FlgG